MLALMYGEVARNGISIHAGTLVPMPVEKTQGNSGTCKGFREHDFSTPPLVKLSA